MLSKKIGKKISEILFYSLKQEAVEKRGEREQWLDCYTKYQFVEFYRKSIEELEFIKRTLMKVLIEEKEKPEDQQDKSLINNLAKTIANNSKVLGELDMTPPVLSRIKSVISTNYFNSEMNKDDQEINTLIAYTQNIESGFCLETDKEDPSIEYEDAPESILKDYVYVVFKIIYNIIYPPLVKKF